jgi:hypothetical protein
VSQKDVEAVVHLVNYTYCERLFICIYYSYYFNNMPGPPGFPSLLRSTSVVQAARRAAHAQLEAHARSAAAAVHASPSSPLAPRQASLHH